MFSSVPVRLSAAMIAAFVHPSSLFVFMRPAAVRAAGPPQCGRRASGGRVVDDVKEFVTNLAYTTAPPPPLRSRKRGEVPGRQVVFTPAARRHRRRGS